MSAAGTDGGLRRLVMVLTVVGGMIVDNGVGCVWISDEGAIRVGAKGG